MDERRSQRVTEALREELNELISQELVDPRLEGVEVAEVQVGPDLRVAYVRLSVPGGIERHQPALDAATGAKAFIKHNLAERLELFRMPELRFEIALSPRDNPRMKSLLRRMRRGRKPKAAQTLEEKSERNP